MLNRLESGPSVSSKATNAPLRQDEMDLFEMANLPTERTGVGGVIYISTAQASYAARVKWCPDLPRDGAPCLSVTIEPSPQAFNHRLSPAAFNAAKAAVQAWVILNRQPLLDFWTQGTSWMDDEVNAFKAALRPLP